MCFDHRPSKTHTQQNNQEKPMVFGYIQYLNHLFVDNGDIYLYFPIKKNFKQKQTKGDYIYGRIT